LIQKSYIYISLIQEIPLTKKQMMQALVISNFGTIVQKLWHHWHHRTGQQV